MKKNVINTADEQPTEVVNEEKVTETPDEQQNVESAKKGENEGATIPESVDAILKLYPQYDECYVDKVGFVYPKDAPKYQRKEAVLYKNKYYKS